MKLKTNKDRKLSAENKAQQDAEALAEHVETIRRLGKQNIENVIEIGKRLILCKEIVKKSVGHGNWIGWLNREFAWSTRQAQNFMNMAELMAELKTKNANFAFSDVPIPLSAWYRLAAPSTPKSVREKVFALATQAQLTHSQITEIIGRGIMARGNAKMLEINLEEDKRHWGKALQEDWVACVRHQLRSAIQVTLDSYPHPQWPSYAVPAELVALAREAAENLSGIAQDLEEQHRRTSQVEDGEEQTKVAA
jgi:hypothetical protein